VDRELEAFDALAKHPRLDALAGALSDEARALVGSRRWYAWPEPLKARVDTLALTDEEATTPFGDLRAVLRRGPENEAETALLRALTAHALASKPPEDAEAEARAAADLMWLGANTPLVALSLVDRALGEELADAIWSAIAARIRKVDGSSVTRAEALVGAAALASSTAPLARKLAARLRREVADDWVKLALGRDEGAVLDGELGVPPRSMFATTLLAITGLLFVASAARLFGRLALAVRKPTTVRVAASGIEIDTRTEMLGRVLRERRIRIDRGSLVRAAREVRYPRLAFYAGLFALAIGSYFGVSLLLDGTRAASPSLLALGLFVIALGIAIDFVLSGLSSGIRGKCRLVFVPRRGAGIAIEGLDAGPADRALETLR
jgi:hypothetical protein